MEPIAFWLISLPPAVLNGLVAGVMGGLAVLVTWPIQRWATRRFESKNAGMVVMVVAMVLSLQLGRSLADGLRRAYMPELLTREIEKQPLFAALFSLHPEERDPFRDALGRVYATSPPDEMATGARNLARELVGTHFLEDLPKASDTAISAYVRASAPVLSEFAGLAPMYCAGYYFIGPVDEVDLTPDLLAAVARSSEVKAELFESMARGDTSASGVTLSPEAAYEALARAYSARGHDPAGIDALGRLDALPLAEACAETIAFNDALVALGPEAAGVLRSMYGTAE